MSPAALVLLECERRDIRITLAGDKLRVDAPPGAVTDALKQAMAREKPAIIEVLQADAQARAAGLIVLATGRLYHAAPARLAGVFVQRDGDEWETYALRWRPARQGTTTELAVAEDRSLYRGRDLARALQAAAQWAEEVKPRGTR